MKIRLNDQVKVMTGKDRGKTGKVIRVLPKTDQVVVEGLNISKRHVGRRSGQEGQIVELVKPMAVANIALVCPECKSVSRIGFKVENNVKSRICKKCKQVI